MQLQRYGRYNIENFLSACECRDKTMNEAIPYHGWYCDIHNRLLCDKSKASFYHGQFYDVNPMNSDKVADCCSNVCKFNDLTNNINDNGCNNGTKIK